MEFPIEEDSPDLTDEEVASASVVTRSEFNDRVKYWSCATCTGPIKRLKFALRRRAPHLYHRITAACTLGHTETVVFRTD